MNKENRTTLFQVSLLQALSLGDYHGTVAIDELKKHGDIGLGTFDELDGEMIMLDGVVYKAAGDGSVSVIDDGTTPFANVTFAKDDITDTVSADSFKDFEKRMDSILKREGTNSVYFIRIRGKFDITIRSIAKQSPPYRKLAEVLSKEQVVWDHKNICGTVVGVYCPAYMSMMNNHGWHLHFISDDRRIGGHVLDLSFDDTECLLTKTDSMNIIIPGTGPFQSLDLSQNQEKDIKSIEGSR
jgi:acetolactate decarboxylase